MNDENLDDSQQAAPLDDLDDIDETQEAPLDPRQLADAVSLNSIAEALVEALDALRVARNLAVESHGYRINNSRLVSEIDDVGRQIRELSGIPARASEVLKENQRLGTSRRLNTLPYELPLSPHQLHYFSRHGHKSKTRKTAYPSQYYANVRFPPPPDPSREEFEIDPVDPESTVYEGILNGPLHGDDIGPELFFTTMIATPCPTCGASSEEPCETSSGETISIPFWHPARMQAAADLAREKSASNRSNGTPA